MCMERPLHGGPGDGAGSPTVILQGLWAGPFSVFCINYPAVQVEAIS